MTGQTSQASPTRPETPVAIIVMGPSGVGKTTTAELIAERLGWPYAEADEFHPKANIEKMESGHPLDDDDRAPWLAAIRDHITERAAEGVSLVLTCSALKVRYRDVLREAKAKVRFVALEGEIDVVDARMAHRKGHFMPKSLLKSQFDTLEPLTDTEDGVVVSVEVPAEEVAENALDALGLTPRVSGV